MLMHGNGKGAFHASGHSQLIMVIIISVYGVLKMTSPISRDLESKLTLRDLKPREVTYSGHTAGNR